MDAWPTLPMASASSKAAIKILQRATGFIPRSHLLVYANNTLPTREFLFIAQFSFLIA
jgi:hypothetical protein